MVLVEHLGRLPPSRQDRGDEKLYGIGSPGGLVPGQHEPSDVVELVEDLARLARPGHGQRRLPQFRREQVADRLDYHIRGQVGYILDLVNRVQTAERVVRLLGLGMRVFSLPIVNIGEQRPAQSRREILAWPAWFGQPVQESHRLTVSSVCLGPGHGGSEVPEGLVVGNLLGSFGIEPRQDPVQPRHGTFQPTFALGLVVQRDAQVGDPLRGPVPLYQDQRVKRVHELGVCALQGEFPADDSHLLM